MSTPSISYVSKMLANPQAITDAEMDQINALKKAYPYFIPGYYLDAARIQQQHPFSAEVIDIMHTTNANWLLFHEFLEQVAKSESWDAPVQRVNPLQEEEMLMPVEETFIEEEFDFAAEDKIVEDDEEEIPEEKIIQAVAEEEDVEDDILAELRSKKNNEQTTQEHQVEGHSLASDFFVEEPGMSTEEGLIFEDDFGHLEPVEEDELLPPFYETNEEEGEIEEEQEETEEEIQEAVVVKEPQEVNHVHQGVEASIAAAQDIYEQESPADETTSSTKHTEDDALIKPIYTEDYFRHEGVEISNDLPSAEELVVEETEEEKQQASLMVMMSFSEWLNHYKVKSKAQKEEDDDRKALKTMWQKEKLKAALEEENDEIPEQVFEMAVNSITHDDGLASESMADIYAKQGKYDKAIDMYRKLSLRNPQKNTYFARKIEEVLKEKQS
jgi:tetratricopeptide (TPR) repeat protein